MTTPNLKQHLKELEARLAGLAKQVELALSYREGDPHASLNKTRSVLEKLLLDMHATEFETIPKKATLAELLGNTQLTRNIPARIRHRMEGIQGFGNLGSHLSEVTASDARRAMDDLIEIIDWYLSLYRSNQASNEPTPEPPMTRSQVLAAELALAEPSMTRGQVLAAELALADEDEDELWGENPKGTLLVIAELQQKHGFTQEHFRKLHHFGPKASVKTHIKYCQGTASFTSETNLVVGRRLALCLKLVRTRVPLADAIERARLELPFPPARK